MPLFEPRLTFVLSHFRYLLFLLLCNITTFIEKAVQSQKNDLIAELKLSKDLDGIKKQKHQEKSKDEVCERKLVVNSVLCTVAALFDQRIV